MLNIVLLPGLDGTGLLFKPLLASLAMQSKVNDVLIISYPKETLSYEQLIQFVLEQCPNEDYMLVGESFSGNIAYHIAQTQPKHLKSVIFVASFLRNLAFSRPVGS